MRRDAIKAGRDSAILGPQIFGQELFPVCSAGARDTHLFGSGVREDTRKSEIFQRKEVKTNIERIEDPRPEDINKLGVGNVFYSERRYRPIDCCT